MNAVASGTGASNAVRDSANAMNLTRADALKSGSACDSDASASEVDGDVPCAGAGARPARDIVRSHVANGAVNGVSVRKISQTETTFPNHTPPAPRARM